MINLVNKRIVVTGGDGFLGRHLVPLLNEKCPKVFVLRHEDYELLDYESVTAMYGDIQPDIVIHLAARVGGIQFNQKNPGTLFYENIKMGINMIHAGMMNEVEKFVNIGTVCSYPSTPPVPFKEDSLWDGYPELTNASYGVAKKALLTMCQAYRKQYNMNCIYLMPCNLFGSEDNFTEEQGHVIPMLIKRFIEAKEKNLKKVTVWGSGKATREFLYAGDAAKAIVEATRLYSKPEPMNIGSGQETSIKDLAELIAYIVGYQGDIAWDKSKPDGQPRRLLDVTRMRKELALDYTTNYSALQKGLIKTINWYKENRNV
jgi:GDP-L-fucose synthase